MHIHSKHVLCHVGATDTFDTLATCWSKTFIDIVIDIFQRQIFPKRQFSEYLCPKRQLNKYNMLKLSARNDFKSDK